MSRFNRTREKTERARRLRRVETDVERKLWWRLRNGQICDAQFRRQHPAGCYILDFYCPALRLAIELDGGQHAEGANRDRVRDEWLGQHGVTVLRFWNSDIVENINGVLELIAAKITELSASEGAPINRWRGSPLVDPHPALARRPPPFSPFQGEVTAVPVARASPTQGIALLSIHRRWWFVVAAVAIAALPLVLRDSYWRTNLVVCALNVILAIGLDFVLGCAGQLNLGHAAFYGIGAYASTLLIMDLGVPFWAAFVLGAMLAGIAGMTLALFAARLRGHYLAIASLGFAVIVHQVLLNWISLTQGPLGIYAIRPPPAIALPGLPVVTFGEPASMFYLVAGFAFLFYALLDQLIRSPIGEALAAIREDEVSAASFGINCTGWKVFAFGIASAFAGAAGGFYASFVGTLVPDAFTITESFTLLAMVIVGGMGTLIGPVWGALLLTVLPELFRGFGDFRLVVYGATLTLAVLFMPGGIVQAGRILRRRIGAFAKPAQLGLGS